MLTDPCHPLAEVVVMDLRKPKNVSATKNKTLFDFHLVPVTDNLKQVTLKPPQHQPTPLEIEPWCLVEGMGVVAEPTPLVEEEHAGESGLVDCGLLGGDDPVGLHEFVLESFELLSNVEDGVDGDLPWGCVRPEHQCCVLFLEDTSGIHLVELSVVFLEGLFQSLWSSVNVLSFWLLRSKRSVIETAQECTKGTQRAWNHAHLVGFRIVHQLHEPSSAMVLEHLQEEYRISLERRNSNSDTDPCLREPCFVDQAHNLHLPLPDLVALFLGNCVELLLNLWWVKECVLELWVGELPFLPEHQPGVERISLLPTLYPFLDESILGGEVLLLVLLGWREKRSDRAHRRCWGEE